MLNAEEGLRPLIALIHVLLPECQCVFNSMLTDWYLVKDRQSQCTSRLCCLMTTCLFWHSRIGMYDTMLLPSYEILGTRQKSHQTICYID